MESDKDKAAPPIDAREVVGAAAEAISNVSRYEGITFSLKCADEATHEAFANLRSADAALHALLAQPPADTVARLVEAAHDVDAHHGPTAPGFPKWAALRSALTAHRASLDALGAGRGACMTCAIRAKRMATDSNPDDDVAEARAALRRVENQRDEARAARDRAIAERDEARKHHAFASAACVNEQEAHAATRKERDAAQADLAKLRADPRLGLPYCVTANNDGAVVVAVKWSDTAARIAQEWSPPYRVVTHEAPPPAAKPVPAYAAADLTQIARMDRIEARLAGTECAQNALAAKGFDDRTSLLLTTAARFVSAGAEAPSLNFLADPKSAAEWLGAAGIWLRAAEAEAAKREGAPS